MKTFEEFLQESGISVVEGRIKIQDASKIGMLEHEYEILKAKEEGLPAKFKEHADKSVAIEFDHLERLDQKPDKFGCNLFNTHKNYDDEDTWGGTVVGSVKQVWEWAIAESGLCVDEINDLIQDGIEAMNEEVDEDDGECCESEGCAVCEQVLSADTMITKVLQRRKAVTLVELVALSGLSHTVVIDTVKQMMDRKLVFCRGDVEKPDCVILINQ